MTLEEQYQRMLQTPSDIRAHLPELRALSKGRVVEMGVRGGVSTTALLAGQPDSLVLIDIAPRPDVFARLHPVRGRTALDYAWASSLTLRLPYAAIDLLFIDTLHTYSQLKAELTRHAPYAARIALHDTETFGEVGEDGGPGIWPAVQELRGWRVESHDPRDNGLTVIVPDSRSAIHPVKP